MLRWFSFSFPFEPTNTRVPTPNPASLPLGESPWLYARLVVDSEISKKEAPRVGGPSLDSWDNGDEPQLAGAI